MDARQSQVWSELGGVPMAAPPGVEHPAENNHVEDHLRKHDVDIASLDIGFQCTSSALLVCKICVPFEALVFEKLMRQTSLLMLIDRV